MNLCRDLRFNTACWCIHDCRFNEEFTQFSIFFLFSFEGFHKVGICLVLGSLPVPTELRGNVALLPLTEGYSKIWQHAWVVLTVTPLQTGISRGRPRTGRLHRRTEITGLEGLRPLHTPSMNWRTSLCKVQDLTRNFLKKHCM